MVAAAAMRRSAMGAAACVLAALGACTFPEVPIDPGEARMIVQGVLDPSRDDQSFAVGFTDGAYPDGARPGITVTVTTPNGVVMTAGANGRIRLSTYGVTLVPGATYSLRATSTAGHIVTGTTTIPNATASSLKPPVEVFRRTSDTVRMSAPSVDGAASFEINVAQTYSGGPNETFSYTNYRSFNKGEITLAGTARAPLEDSEIFPSGIQSLVILAAVDVNYYEYYRVLADPFAGATASRLSGGLGVFGSVVPVAVRRLDVR
jgi:hypothetical protein